MGYLELLLCLFLWEHLFWRAWRGKKMTRLTDKRKQQLAVEAKRERASSGIRELLEEVEALEKELKEEKEKTNSKEATKR